MLRVSFRHCSGCDVGAPMSALVLIQWLAGLGALALFAYLGYALLRPHDTAVWIGCALADLQALSSSWSDLPPDDFLKDGGRYRRRRHACFVVDGADVIGRGSPPDRRAVWAGYNNEG